MSACAKNPPPLRGRAEGACGAGDPPERSKWWGHGSAYGGVD
jgi:hypothetical protein